MCIRDRSTARAFDADPMPFVMAVLYGASAGFLIPFGYQTHLMVSSPGRYRMLDFARMGLPITPVSYTHLRAHETSQDLVCRLLLEKKKHKRKSHNKYEILTYILH